MEVWRGVSVEEEMEVCWLNGVERGRDGYWECLWVKQGGRREEGGRSWVGLWDTVYCVAELDRRSVWSTAE